MLPGVGAIVGGGLDLVETKVIADRAYKWFMTGDFSVKGESNDDVIDIDKYNDIIEDVDRSTNQKEKIKMLHQAIDILPKESKAYEKLLDVY